MRRYKKKLRDHHERLEISPEEEMRKARNYVLAAAPEQDDDPVSEEREVPVGDDPAVIAEMTSEIQTMSVSDAVMRLDLSGEGALMFYNASNNGLNMVYKRSDGNIGWVDPEGHSN